MKKISPYKVAQWLKKLKWKNPYVHTIVKSFLIGMSCFIGIIIGILPLWCGPDGIFLYLIVAPIVLGYAHFCIDCFDY